MSAKNTIDKITVLDFGSQYSHLICRRIRDFSVYAELAPYDVSMDDLAQEEHNLRGVIFSGGPASVRDIDAPIPQNDIFESGLPVLGICYGHQVIVDRYGGSIKRANREYGSSVLSIDDGTSLLRGIGDSVRAWMSHGDEAESTPADFDVIGHTENSKAAAIASRNDPIYGIQFHPEVVHTEQGTRILQNFVLDICRAKQEWTMEKFVDGAVSKIASISGNVLCGVSGGVDSTVAALLIHRAIGNRLRCVFVDNGLLRKGEAQEIADMFCDNFGVNFKALDAAGAFLSALGGVSDPESKRKIIGREFVRVFSDYAKRQKKDGSFEWLAQGTLYPDVIESGVSKGPAEVIKSHHNVGGLPECLDLKVLEPLRDLYKDEVRKVARILGVPQSIYMRHPFPGPGLAVRVIGEVTPEKLEIARTASFIVEDELASAGLYDDTWQAYAAVGDDKAVGVVGDGRMYGNIVMIRVVNSIDAMTADWSRLPHGILEKMSNRITNEIEDVTWVSYAISSKPPATIEPQ